MTLTPAPKSLFIYLLENGVAVVEYTSKVPGRYSYSHRDEIYAAEWPEQWAAYRAMCRLLDVYPH